MKNLTTMRAIASCTLLQLLAIPVLALENVIINTDVDGLELSGDNAILYFSGSHTASNITVAEGTTFTALQINSSAQDLTNIFTLRDSDFSGAKFIDATNAWSALVGKNGADYHNAIVANTKFVNSSFEAYGYSWATCFTFYNAAFENVDFSGATFRANASVDAPQDGDDNGRSEALWISCSALNNVNFSNVRIELSSEDGTGVRNPVTLSGAEGRTYTIMTNVDFRGASVKLDSAPAEIFGLQHIHLSSDGNRAQIKNAILGDGTILSSDMHWTGGDTDATFEEYGQVNEGLWLRDSSDRFTIRGNADSINARLTVNSYAVAGTIELLEGAIFEIADGVTLTLSDEVSIIFAANADVNAIDDIFVLGENSTIVMAGYESDEAAQAAFIGLLKDSEGNGVNWSPESVAEFVKGAVPEPSQYAALFGAIAIALVAYRKRR